MAMKPWTAEQIQSVSNDLAYAAKKFGEIADAMREKEFQELTLQADAAFGIYRSTLVKLAGDVETEFRDQYRCSQTGETPRWKINQKMIAARKKAAPANAEPTAKPRKKAAKKSSKK